MDKISSNIQPTTTLNIILFSIFIIVFVLFIYNLISNYTKLNRKVNKAADDKYKLCSDDTCFHCPNCKKE